MLQWFDRQINTNRLVRRVAFFIALWQMILAFDFIRDQPHLFVAITAEGLGLMGLLIGIPTYLVRMYFKDRLLDEHIHQRVSEDIESRIRENL